MSFQKVASLRYRQTSRANNVEEYYLTGIHNLGNVTDSNAFQIHILGNKKVYIYTTTLLRRENVSQNA